MGFTWGAFNYPFWLGGWNNHENPHGTFWRTSIITEIQHTGNLEGSSHQKPEIQQKKRIPGLAYDILQRLLIAIHVLWLWRPSSPANAPWHPAADGRKQHHFRNKPNKEPRWSQLKPQENKLGDFFLGQWFFLIDPKLKKGLEEIFIAPSLKRNRVMVVVKDPEEETGPFVVMDFCSLVALNPPFGIWSWQQAQPKTHRV